MCKKGKTYVRLTGAEGFWVFSAKLSAAAKVLEALLHGIAVRSIVKFCTFVLFSRRFTSGLNPEMLWM